MDQRVRVAQQVVDVVGELLPDLGADRLGLIKSTLWERIGEYRPEAVIGLVPNLAASRIANRLDLQGPAYTVDAACASSLLAVEQAMTELRSGRCDVMLAGGVHHCHDVTFWSVFVQLGALSTSQQIRPFSRHADGLLIGEGTGVVVLKRLDDALESGDRIYAVLRGVGVASDGRDSTLMRPKVEGQILALERAWGGTGLDPASVGCIEAHGTATPAGDAAEVETLARFFGREGPGGSRSGGTVALGSVKSMIGHAMPAAGIAGLIKAALALHHRTLPPTLHAEEPNPALEGTRFELLYTARPWEVAPGEVRRIGVNAFGFGGINAHAVLEEAPTPRTGAAPAMPLSVQSSSITGAVTSPVSPPSQLPTLVRLAAADPAGLLELLDRVEADQAVEPTRPTPESDLREVGTGACRLALVGPTPRSVTLARKVITQGRPWRGRSGVWFSPDGLIHRGGRVALLFPGVEPTFAPRVDDVAAWLGRPAPEPVAGHIGFQGRAILSLAGMLTEAFGRLGIAPDCFAGHSVGEWSGMIAAGIVPTAELERLLADIDPADLEVPGVGFAALGCGADVAAQLVVDHPEVVVSHDNCPHQSIVCGPDAAIAAVVAAGKERRIMGQVLPFRSGFHSPAFEPHLGQVRRHNDTLDLQSPTRPMYSATTTAPYPTDPEAIRALVIRHLLEPVRFREMLERLYSDGVRVFVQMGVGSLPAFVDDTFHDREVMSVSAASEKTSGLDQLVRAAAALWVEGAQPDLSALAAQSPPATEPASRRGDEPSPERPAEERGRPLRLGVPLLHLGDAAAALRPQVPEGSPVAGGNGHDGVRRLAATGDPLFGDLAALLDDTQRVSGEVIDLVGSRRGSTGRTDAPPTPRQRDAPAFPQPAPGQSEPAQSEPRAAATAKPPPESGTHRLRVSLEEMPWIIDHSLFRQAENWPEVDDRFPIVPLTAILELLGEHALLHAPDRVVTGYRDVRAMRWLHAVPAHDVPVKVSPVADGFKVSIEGYARGIVTMGDRYPEAPAADREGFTNERPAPVTAAQFYTEGWTFHGPGYQGITVLGPDADDGIRATCMTLPAQGALLDLAGQLFGYWILVHSAENRTALPQRVERIELFGPHPQPGAELICTVRVQEVAPRSVRCNMEMSEGDRVWVRITGWEDRRFDTDEVVWPFLLRPEEHLLSERQPGGWFLTRERWPDTASRELMARRFTTSSERVDYDGRTPLQQRQWLLGRVAAKDAIRHLLFESGRTKVFPAEITISNDPSGRPIAEGPATPAGTRISLAHKGPFAVALAVSQAVPAGSTTAGGVGIDIEEVGSRRVGFEELTLTEREREIVAGLIGESPASPIERDRVLTRFWAVKEAAAKAAGTGLGGRPKDFEVSRIDGTRHLVGSTWVDTATPDTSTEGEFVVAWTEH